ncbi:MAG: S-methyl-5-thioribose-1-phosphate isomerase [Candidatus Hydrogenedentes bacterium]|nr:S-methyl-5-thioribose-1-phosphate isomerase [Candidatus Hydrogenedentota bacterium]
MTGQTEGRHSVALQTVRWEDGHLYIIDQTLLPTEFKEIRLDTQEAVWEAIKSLRVRGAPAIGVCAAFGVLVGFRQLAPPDAGSARQAVRQVAGYLATSRPTAVNLFWALNRMRAVAEHRDAPSDVETLYARLESEARSILEEDGATCRAIGESGESLIRDGDGVLTHCNAGGLATAGYGTALAVMFRAHEKGRRFQVFADETRPLLQGARLTTWELMQAGIDTTLICDNTAAQVMREGRIHLVIVGADRIAANGDTANKIGTYNVALIAKAHDIPFYVAAPVSTFDLDLSSGDGIPIELRGTEEVTQGFGVPTAPENVRVYSPAFDVTPSRLITGIITERGVLRPPLEIAIAALGGGQTAFA